MNEQKKLEIEQLAALMLGMDYDALVNNHMQSTIHDCVKENWGIDFDDFCDLVWKLMDYTPILSNGVSKKNAHVLGAMMDVTHGHPAFLAIVTKEDRYE